MRMANEIYPLTILKDRYRGTYSGGKYLAFNLDPDEVPIDAISDDVTCRQFFYDVEQGNIRIPIGIGDSVHLAVVDLGEKLGMYGILRY